MTMKGFIIVSLCCLATIVVGKDCRNTRIDNISKIQKGSHGIFVPKCKSDGTFEVVQCLNQPSICWCVDTNTGYPVKGTLEAGTKMIKAKCGLSKCQLERKEALERKAKELLLTVFIPQCQKNGFFKVIQCFLNSCYCVDEKTGAGTGGKVVPKKNASSLQC